MAHQMQTWLIRCKQTLVSRASEAHLLEVPREQHVHAGIEEQVRPHGEQRRLPIHEALEGEGSARDGAVDEVEHSDGPSDEADEAEEMLEECWASACKVDGEEAEAGHVQERGGPLGGLGRRHHGRDDEARGEHRDHEELKRDPK